MSHSVNGFVMPHFEKSRQIRTFASQFSLGIAANMAPVATDLPQFLAISLKSPSVHYRKTPHLCNMPLSSNSK